ncbi:hypothetical protein LTR97_002952 [Elasticomyces elasticus]|uniref:PrpF protein n=1 Tax=Elasticomyces elasticus TaxID=574655 RepID=A0AAN7WFK7_9PEZI|nr:hypothetical protein LTR97_002952 [Elasticomyces elasticus]
MLATKSYLPRTASLPATFMRGGTSNGLLIHRHHLPVEQKEWQPILSSIMGSPDHTGRQLNGMGSGTSSTSKVLVVSKSERVGVDVDYTFIQVGIKDGSLDMAGNCGNMSSAVGPFAINEALITPSPNHHNNDNNDDNNKLTARMFNTNTSKLIHSTFLTKPSNIDPKKKIYDPIGPYTTPGVPSTGSPITLSFLHPGGATTGRTLPTGNPIDILALPDGSTIKATLTDISNPGVFIRASDLGVAGDISPSALSEDAGLMGRLETIRRAGAQLMGLDEGVQSVPKIVLLSPPSPEMAGEGEGVSIVCRALSMGEVHKAVPLTLALNLGVSCGIKGTLAHQLAVNVSNGDGDGDGDGGKKGAGTGKVTIAHPSGTLEVGFVRGGDGEVESAELGRTSRVLMKGEVFYSV